MDPASMRTLLLDTMAQQQAQPQQSQQPQPKQAQPARADTHSEDGRLSAVPAHQRRLEAEERSLVEDSSSLTSLDGPTRIAVRTAIEMLALEMNSLPGSGVKVEPVSSSHTNPIHHAEPPLALESSEPSSASSNQSEELSRSPSSESYIQHRSDMSVRIKRWEGASPSPSNTTQPPPTRDAGGVVVVCGSAFIMAEARAELGIVEPKDGDLLSFGGDTAAAGSSRVSYSICVAFSCICSGGRVEPKNVVCVCVRVCAREYVCILAGVLCVEEGLVLRF